MVYSLNFKYTNYFFAHFNSVIFYIICFLILTFIYVSKYKIGWGRNFRLLLLYHSISGVVTSVLCAMLYILFPCH